MRGKVAHSDNRVIGYGCVWSSLLAAAFSFRQIQSYFTPLCFTPRRVYRMCMRKFKGLMRELCRGEMESYFKGGRWGYE
jgi:hypothetical protein